MTPEQAREYRTVEIMGIAYDESSLKDGTLGYYKPDQFRFTDR